MCVRFGRTMLVRQEVLGPICCTRCTLLAAPVDSFVLIQLKLLCVQLSIVSRCCNEQCCGGPNGLLLDAAVHSLLGRWAHPSYHYTSTS